MDLTQAVQLRRAKRLQATQQFMVSVGLVLDAEFKEALEAFSTRYLGAEPRAGELALESLLDPELTDESAVDWRVPHTITLCTGCKGLPPDATAEFPRCLDCVKTRARAARTPGVG